MELCLSDLMSVVLSGIFSISMVSIAIFALLGNIVNKRAIGLSYVTFFRYSIYALFGSLIIMILEIISIVIWPCIGKNDYFALIFLFVIILYLMFHSYRVLQPIYDIDKFKKAMIDKRFYTNDRRIIRKYRKIFYRFEDWRKHNKRNNSKRIIGELIDLNEKYQNRINNDFIFNYNDIIEIWGCYVEELNNCNVTEKDFFTAMDIGFLLFENDIYLLTKSIDINNCLYIKYLIYNKMNTYDSNVFSTIFDRLYIMVINSSLLGTSENINLLFVFLEIIKDQCLFNNLINKIVSKEWNKKDAIYIHYYIKLLLLKKEEVLKLESIPSKIDYMYKCYENDKNFNESFGRNYDSLLKTCFRLIKEDMDDEK